MKAKITTHIILAGLAAAAIAGLAVAVAPLAGELLAGGIVIAALLGMGLLETRKRAY